MPHYIYIMRCADGRLYTGYTTDVARRCEAHQSGRGAKFTRAFGAGVMVHQEVFEDKSSALRREIAIKRLSRAEKLALINRRG